MLFHISIWGGFGAWFARLSPPKPPRGDGTASHQLVNGIASGKSLNLLRTVVTFLYVTGMLATLDNVSLLYFGEIQSFTCKI